MHTATTPARGAAPVVAWVLAIGAVLALIGTSAAVVVGLVRGIERVEAFWLLSWPGLPIVGAIIVSRRPGNRVGWLLLGIGCGIAVGSQRRATPPSASHRRARRWSSRCG